MRRRSQSISLTRTASLEASKGERYKAKPKIEFFVDNTPSVKMSEYCSQLQKSHNGILLHQGTILKTDYIPFHHDYMEQLGMFGMTSTKSFDPWNVYCCSQPSAIGIMGMINMLVNKEDDSLEILWVNLREEPSIYMNGCSFVLRDEVSPFNSLFSKETVVTMNKVENLEKRLKRDVINETRSLAYGGNVIVHDETIIHNLTKKVMYVDTSSLYTPRELFYMMNIMGYNVQYSRIPIIESYPPTNEALSEIVSLLLMNSSSKSVVFTDMNGHNKSVFCVSVAILIRKWKQLLNRFLDANNDHSRLKTPQCDGDIDLSLNSDSPNESLTSDPLQMNENGEDVRIDSLSPCYPSPIPLIYNLEDIAELDIMDDGEERLNANTVESDNIHAFYDMLLLNGNFAIIMNLVNIYKYGAKIKALVDSVIKLQSPYYNLLQHIINVRASIILATNKVEKQSWQDTAVKLLRKYFLLISVALYLHDTQNQREKTLFVDWFKENRNVNALYESINLNHIDQYLSVECGDESLSSTEHYSMNTSGYLNVHSLLLLQQCMNDNNMMISDSVVISSSSQRIYGTVYVNSTNVTSLTQNWLQLPLSLPKHLFIINIHRSPCIMIDESLYALRDRVSPLMTSPSFANLDMNEQMLNSIESSIVDEVMEFKDRYFVLFGYNEEKHVIDNYKMMIKEGGVSTSKDGLMKQFSHQLEEGKGKEYMKHVTIHYNRISSNHYTIPPYSVIDEFIKIIKSVPDPTSSSSSFLILAHNLGGLLFHLPLLSLLYSQYYHKDEDEEPINSFILDEASDDDSLTFSKIMCLNIITDLTRLLTRGYSHLYAAYAAIQDSAQDIAEEDRSLASTGVYKNLTQSMGKQPKEGAVSPNTVCISLLDYVNEQYTLYRKNNTEGDSNSPLYYSRYLQGIQKIVYLMIIDDFITSSSSVPFEGWMSARPEIEMILQSLNDSNTRVYITQPNVSQRSLNCIEMPMSLEEENDPEDEEDVIHAKPKMEEVHSNDNVFVYRHINGIVLNLNSIIKDDYFPGSRNVHLIPQLEGAPNFRVSGFCDHVYGVGIPMIYGILNVLKFIRGSWGGENITWVNLREEPITYINGKPYSVRNVSDMINNLVYTGIDSDRLLEIEQKLKQDIILESKQNRAMFMINDEDENMESANHLVPITESSVVTLEEVYRKVNRNDPESQVSLFRVPITDEQAPLVTTIDHLLSIVTTNYKDVFVFNCQIGRGRTTTGMIIASMALSFKQGKWHDIQFKEEKNDLASLRQTFIRNTDNQQSILLLGYYTCVNDLIVTMKRGYKAKKKLDYIIDLSSDMQNIREVIYHYHSVSVSPQISKSKKEMSKDRAIHFLHRYCILLILAEYFEEHLPDEDNPVFSEWLQQHEEYSEVLKRISLE